MNRPSDLAARLQAGLDGDPDQRAATTLLTHAGHGVWLAKLDGWDTYLHEVADLRRPAALVIDWARLRADLAADDTARTQFADWAASHRGRAATDTEHDARWQATVPTRPWHGASTSELVLLRIALDLALGGPLADGLARLDPANRAAVLAAIDTVATGQHLPPSWHTDPPQTSTSPGNGPHP